MLRPRLIPCLLVQNSGLVKTIKFGNPKYVGDPINAVRIFNEKMVDELMIVDIDATRNDRKPDYDMIAKLANECRMPLCYSGGIKKVEQVEKIISLGVEKVAISSAAIADPDLISQAAERVGAQSVVVVLDIKKAGMFRKLEAVTHNATRRTKLDPAKFIEDATDRGAGEIVLNFVDRDGTMEGYDLEAVAALRQHTSLPMTVLGGAGSLDDVAKLWKAEQIIGAAAGSLFVFKGRYRAVLINYPNIAEKASLWKRAGIS